MLSQKENTYEVKKHLLSDGANTKTDSGAAAYSNIEDSSVTPEAIMAKGGHYAKCKPGEKVKEDTDKEHYYKLTFENSVGDFVKGGYSDSTGQHHGAVHLVERFYKKYQVYSCVYSYTVTNDKTRTLDYYYFIYIWRVLVDEGYHKATADDYLTYCIQYGIPINKSEAAYAKEKSVYNDLTPDEQYRLACAIYYGPHRASDGTYYSSLNKKAGDSVKCYDPSTWSKALFLRYSATQFYIWTVTDPQSFSVADAKKTAKQFDKDYQTANESCYDFLLSLIDYVDTAVKVPSFMKETKNQAQSTAVKLQQQTDGTYQKELKDSRGMLLTGSFTCSNTKVNVIVDSASRLILTSSEPVDSAMLTFTKKQQVPKAKLGLLYYADGKSQNMVNPIAEAEDYHAYLAVQTAENHSDEGVISIYKEDEETRTVLSGAVYQVLTTSKTAAVYNPQTHTSIIDPDTGKTLDAAKFIAGYLYKDDVGYHLIPYTSENKTWIDNQGISECHIAYNIAYYCNGVRGYRISTRDSGEAQTEPMLRKKTTGTGENITTTWYSYYFIEVEPPEHYTLPYPVVLGEDGSLQKGQVCLKQNQGQTTWKEYELQLRHTNREIPGSLEIYKMDERDLKPLEGVVFHVYSDSDCTKLIAVLVTDNNGRASLSGLHSGDYYVQEMSGQDGYMVVRNLRQVCVLSGEETIVEFFNEPVVVCISIQKQLDEQLKFADESQRKKAAAISLEGAEYALYAGSNIYGANGTLLFEKDAYIYTLRTDAAGKASVPKEFSEEFLRQGEYYLVETVAPKGFLLNPEPVSVHAVSLSDPQCNEDVDEYAQENVIYCNVTLRELPAQIRIHIKKVQKGLEKDVTEPLSG
ncbi:MAG: hypothetical protein K2G89_02640, partial [Lachnospiraceae bacterium]|nr:hypothetical protein [Lachnospiraceae bacterium]